MSAKPRSPRARLRSDAAGRLRLFLLLIAVVVSVFGVRLVELQGLDPQAYALKAEKQGARTTQTVPLPAKRGRILDRNGEPLAESVEGRMLIADPKLAAPYAGDIARLLARRLDVDYFDTLAKLRKRASGDSAAYSRFQYLDRRVPSTLAENTVTAVRRLVERKQKALGIENPPAFAGVYTESDPLRVYPAKDVAANLVGFLGDDGKPSGGLELAFDKTLAGKDGKETYEVGDGNRIPLGENSTIKPRNGKDVRLTLDRDVSWYVQRVLRNAVEGARADSGSAVVMRADTGEVLALADYPTFDANQPGKAPKADLGSRALQNVYEPGSVEKVLTFSSLLDDHKITPTTQITVPSELPVADRTIHDWFEHPTLHLTATGVVAKSSNIGTALASTQMSNQEMYDHLSAFGLGRKTGVGLFGETNGLLPAWQQWGSVNHATISFGQGISVNTLQMATAINAVANGGMLVTPSLIAGEATNDAGDKVGTDVTQRRRVVSADAASQMSQMMEMVPNPESGTAPGAQVPGYRVAGKTGTAQRVGATCGCYDGTFTVSFAGFAPADKPAFTVYVVIQNPRNGGGGGSIGGPAFAQIQSFLMQRYGIAPTGTPAADLPIEWGPHPYFASR